MNELTREEIQDLEDALHDAAELIAWKQESRRDYSDADIKRMNRYVQRLVRLTAKLKTIDRSIQNRAIQSRLCEGT